MLFISDIHGVLPALEKALEQGEQLGFHQLIILGDVLNHGPRNPVLPGYAPAQVADCLNTYAERIIAVRGNCDSEVDQMLCQFPLMAPYNWLPLEGRRLFLTHGHLYHPESLPPMSKGDGIIYGHTHKAVATWHNDHLLFNPGSITLSKTDQPESFGHFDGETFRVLDLTGKELTRVAWNRQ